MFEFINKKNWFFAVSGIIILAGIIAFIAFGGLNLGLDFTGGTTIRMDIGKDFNTDDVLKLTKGITNTEVVVQKVGDANTEALIKTPEIDTALRDKIVEAMKKEYTLDQVALLETNNVSASASTKLITDALKSVLYAMVLMLVYITIRFDFKSGLSAIINLTHNVLIMLSVYAIFQLTIGVNFIAAILTIVGYSINDTIVIFDKIRENRKLDKKSPFDRTANLSLNQTVKRSLNTSITTLVTILALYILGVDSIKDFCLPIIIGIVVGTYASMCIATPTWVLLREVSFSKKKAKKA